MSFAKILIANRGEIACRVMRTAKAMGYRTVAVFSEADADAVHVRLADEAVCIGPAPAAASYLNIAALLDVARKSGADAVHPGYGFLSENASFARACVEAGLVFIGPRPETIEAMGSKSAAKRLMRGAGVPCLPGYLGEAQDDATLIAEAAQLGYPLLVKAVAGGGGRGMRRVDAADVLTAALSGARREALAAFGHGGLMLEAWVGAGRHIEVQVFGDTQGQIVHLGERDCTTQRRRQKLIEEAPAPGLSAEQRYALCTDAVRAAQAVNYVGAGTVEFMLDAQGQHYFLEMNTRLQVEHPVTESITGLDLVEWQLRVAAGEALPLRQEQIRVKGHAIEVRLYAEDPFDGFRPCTGVVAQWTPPTDSQHRLRVDAGIETGSIVGPHYDALLAKFVTHAPDRVQARRRLALALEDLPPLGLIHNACLLHDLLLSDEPLHTATLDTLPLRAPEPEPRDWLSAAALLTQCSEPRPLGVARYGLTLECGGQKRQLRIAPGQIEMDGSTHAIKVLTDGVLDIDGLRFKPLTLKVGGMLWLSRNAAQFAFSEPAAQRSEARTEDGRAPVTGLVSQVLVKPGDVVTAGQPLLSVEAMKMEMWLAAPRAGRVKSVLATVGHPVSRGALLLEMEPEGDTQ